MVKMVVSAVAVVGQAAYVSDDIGRRGSGMSIKDCMRTPTSSVGDERAVFIVSSTVMPFTLNNCFQADIALLEVMRRKERRDGAPTSIVAVTSVDTASSPSFSTGAATCTVTFDGAEATRLFHTEYSSWSSAWHSDGISWDSR